MDIRTWSQKLLPIIKQYRYALLVLVVGLVLMVLPVRKDAEQTVDPISASQEQKTDPAQQLERILATIQGVGKVQVLLTVKEGETTLYHYDEDTTVSDTGSTIRKETVIIQDGQRNEQALIVQVLPPQYMGAVIVCQGAENPQVRLAVVEAVCNATGLGADKISVLKMKG